MLADRFVTWSLQDPRILRILNATLESVEPGQLVQQALRLLPQSDGDYYVLGLGKASQPMVEALSHKLPIRQALIITKYATPTSFPFIKIIEGGHPIPDKRSLKAGKAALDFVTKVRTPDHLICLISGGGSALAVFPVPGVSLQDVQSLTSRLLKSGASIQEINTLRRSLDRLKGGGLSAAASASMTSLILSDVLGNPLEAIASGPTAQNPTTNLDSLRILQKYSVTTPKSIVKYLSTPFRGEDRININNIKNHIIGDIHTAARAAQIQADRQGFKTRLMQLNLQGEARQVGSQLAVEFLESTKKSERPYCLIAGGESIVTVRGNGKGGRCQELALATVDLLAGLKDVVFIALATDGDDGPTDAAGAVVTGETRQRAQALGLSPAEFLARNDAYTFFGRLSDLLKPGPSGTNVNDLYFMFAL